MLLTALVKYLSHVVTYDSMESINKKGNVNHPYFPGKYSQEHYTDLCIYWKAHVSWGIVLIHIKNNDESPVGFQIWKLQLANFNTEILSQ